MQTNPWGFGPIGINLNAIETRNQKMKSIHAIASLASNAMASALHEEQTKTTSEPRTLQTLMRICLFQQAQIEALQRALIPLGIDPTTLVITEPRCGDDDDDDVEPAG